MGTSKGYKMPSGGDWTPLKAEATKFVRAGDGGPVAPRTLLRDYMKVRSFSNGSDTGGSSPKTSGRKSGDSSGGGHWGAGVTTAKKLGGFFSRIGEVGLSEALSDLGLGDLVGKSAAEISGALLDKLAGPASTLDQASAREALIALNDELLAEADTFEEVEAALTSTLDDGGLFAILLRFFGHYVYQCFCTDFYERFVKQVGSSRAAHSLKSVRDCIEAAIKAKLAAVDLKKFNWSGRDAERMSEQVLNDIREIFEVPL